MMGGTPRADHSFVDPDAHCRSCSLLATDTGNSRGMKTIRAPVAGPAQWGQ